MAALYYISKAWGGKGSLSESISDSGVCRAAPWLCPGLVRIWQTGKTWRSCMCVIQQYRTDTIPYVIGNTLNPSLYHRSMSIP